MDVEHVEDGKFGSNDLERDLELQMFRERWKDELDRNKENNASGSWSNQPESLAPASRESASLSAAEEPTSSRSKFEIAAEIFQEGIKEERDGRHFEAVRLYRRAIQLDPDIEHKFEKSTDAKKGSKSRTAKDATNRDIEDEGVEEISAEELLENLLGFNIAENGTCQPALPANGTHISALPCEIVQYLTQWIVSAELDMLSLEQFARVCKGFYRVARDDTIWRLACYRIWGTCRPEDNHYASYREMLLMRPQVRFNGLYISRISYVRAGESSFIDQAASQYQAWYSVQYYRFFRFFADGTVLYANTPDEPLLIVPRLRSRQTAQNRDQQQPNVLFGHYTLSADGTSVVVFLKRDVFKDDFSQRYQRNRRPKRPEGHEILTMHLIIRDTRERLHARLDWRRYTITRCIGKTESESIVEVNPQHFPSCLFSRVKSYAATSEAPLV